MEHNLSNIQLYAYACLIFIITGVVCGIVRWNHMCRPFNENGDFHYPARRLVSFFYIAIALEFPYVLSPTTPDYWTYVKIFGIIFYPVCMTTLFSSYFFRKRLRDSILLKTYLFSAFALLLSLLAIALTMGGHVLTDAGNRRHRERSAVDNTPPLPRAASAEIGSAVGNPERQSQRRKQIHNPTGILQPREHVPPAARRTLQGGTSGSKTGGNCRRVGILVAHGILQGAQKRGGNRRQNREECETLNPLYRHDFRTFSRTLATEVAR